MTSEGGPQVIVTDRDLALMNFVGIVFPECYHLLSHFHIQKNVHAKCKMLVNSVDAWDFVLQAWENVIECEDELKFNDCVNHLELVCQSWPVFFEYVNDSWIIPHKKYFVKLWMNKVMHLGNATSNKYVCIFLLIHLFLLMIYMIPCIMSTLNFVRLIKTIN